MQPAIRRYALVLLLAAGIDVFVGAVAWRVHVERVGLLLDMQSATARAFLAYASDADPARLLDAIARPEINVHVSDASGAPVIDYRDGEIRNAPPPQEGPPPQGPPGAGRPGGNRMEMIAADLAHVRPRTIVQSGYTVVLVASAGALLSWLLVDVASCTIVLLALIAFGLLAARTLDRAARKPLLRTTLALEALADGDFTPQTVDPGDAPEIARLARAYNAAAETVSRSIEERRKAAAEFQRFLADAGHELRTPLTIVGGYIDILAGRDNAADATERRVIDGMLAQTGRLRAMVEKMLLLSRLESTAASPRNVPVGPVAREVADTLRDSFPDRDIAVRCDESAAIFIDEDDLYEAQRNLVENALRYAGESPVEVLASRDGDSVRIDVADRGPGIPADEQTMVFERFYRGKERKDAEGSGLGLAIVRRIVERWGGSVALRSDARGTRVTMRFPAVDAPA